MNKVLAIADGIQETAPDCPKQTLPFAWRWVIIVSTLLGISGGIRYWRDRQFETLSKQSETSPFALRDISSALGDWHAIEGSEERLEPEIVRITGATDYVIRKYVNEKSDQTARVMVLYGLAHIVCHHRPDVCLPSTGFKSVLPSRDQYIEIPIPGKSTTAPFRVEHYVKSIGGQTDYREFYYSFQNARRWGVNMAENWKSFRYNPGMFKVQVEFQASNSDKIDESKVPELLELIVQEIERRSDPRG